MSELRDFLNWFDGFAENIEKTPTPKQWAKIKERVSGLQAMPGVAPAQSRTYTDGAAASTSIITLPHTSRPEPQYPFIIDKEGYVRRGKGKKQRVLPGEISSEVYDLRPQGEFGADLNVIVWADNSTGLNGADLTIVAG